MNMGKTLLILGPIVQEPDKIGSRQEGCNSNGVWLASVVVGLVVYHGIEPCDLGSHRLKVSPLHEDPHRAGLLVVLNLPSKEQILNLSLRDDKPVHM